ncbi:CCR4-NOT transcription complex subunit 1 isoform X3 [Cimex lectularius]|uniref:CCR4-NOT transcription complex subunit 1 n=1 Tax=Cimex lectularius TaxID=79782 RepID=A0A8I6TFI0_CIMLE|nr:CCR4-NOT transcription complex subunit 1 isoform X3 [Cimex lectularius]
MNLDSLTLTLSQISYLVINLTKKNYTASVKEISKLVREYGFEADRHYLRSLFCYFEVGVTYKESPQLQLLSEECTALLSKPAFVSSICFAFEKLIETKGPKTTQLLPQFSKAVKLSPIQEVVFGIALLYSHNTEVASQATQFLKIKLPELIRSYINSDSNNCSVSEGGLSDTSPEVLHIILSEIHKLNSLELFGLTAETKEAFLHNLRRDFPRDLVPIVLAPLLYSDNSELSMEKLLNDSNNMSHNMVDSSVDDVVGELGLTFTNSVEGCRGHIAQLAGRELKASDMAHVLIMMLKSRAVEFWLESEAAKEKSNDPLHIPSPWSIDNLIKASKELNPKLNWADVFLELDHPEFIVKNRHSLYLIIHSIRSGIQSQQSYIPHSERFPVDHIYRTWKNPPAQLSLLQQILKNPDIFCLADYPFHSIPVEILKTPPETENKEVTNWRSLSLLETVLNLAERGGLFPDVQDLLKVPAQLCPDVLALGLLQVPLQMSNFRLEILGSIMPIFLGNHPNSGIILHQAWHTSQFCIKQTIMHAMADWYLRGDSDQSRLSRILDVAQDLKALSLLLNAQSYPFVIDLACLASRRGYLKLEKWLTDKIREHDEPFITELLKFLQKRVPHISGMGKEESISKSQLPHETLSTIILSLQTCVGNVSQDLSEAIHNAVATCGVVVNKSRQAPPGVLRPHRGLEPFSQSSVYSSQVDSLNSGLAGMSLATTSTAFTLPAALGQLVSNPGSPSRLMAASQSPAFPIMPLGAPGPSLVPQVGVNVPATMARLQLAQQQQPLEKTKISNVSTNLFRDMTFPVPKDIEDEANSYFQRIYNHPPHPTISIDDVLDMLKKFMDSPKQRERDVFYCMLRNLFEEYKFFPQYPDKELFVTAQLFGGIIERGLVSDYRELGMALRYVLDALKKPLDSKMFYFGIAALDRFKSRLKDYHNYCEYIMSIPHFSRFPSHLIEYLEYGLQSEEPPNRPQGPILPGGTSVVTTAYNTLAQTTVTTTTTVATKVSTTSVISSRPSIANATNIDTLLVATEKEDKMVTPPESLQDKVAFIFNNLSQLNLQTKCDELREIVSEEYYAWMAQYLVMKRASIELNFHILYSNFLDVLKIPELNVLVLQETFRNIRVLLRSDKGTANFSDRSLLKNLGHWLGMLTLGRNKPILHDDLDLKSLLVEAYSKGQQELLYVVPFVAKVLESCSKSQVFKPPNPWTMAIMNVLAELHQEADLKLNLKFEIEVLCKNLSLDVSELHPKIYLKDPENLKNLEHQLSPPKSKVEVQSTTPLPPSQTPTQQATHNANEETPTRLANNTPTLTPINPPEPRFNYLSINVTNIGNLAPHIIINTQMPLLQSHPQLKQYIRPALERAVQEWIHPVVDRAVKIAVTTTEQIVKKDFALEPEESRMRAAAHHMVRNLAAGMAMITCRDQLLVSISNNLKANFLSALHNATEQQKSLIEQAASLFAQENMELACCFIQKTAMEKAVPEMDKLLLPEYERRKIARTEGRRYCDSSVLTYQAERMPEHLRLKVGGVTPQQTAVYEDLARNIPGFQPLTERDTAIFIPKPVDSMTIVPSFPSAIPQMAYSTGGDELDSIFDKLTTELDHYVQTVLGNHTLPAVHNILDLLVLTRRNREDLYAMSLVQKTVENLLELSTTSLDSEFILRHRELYLRILKTLQDPRAYGVQWTNKQVTRAYLDCREEIKYNLDCLDVLLRNQFINLLQLDLHLAHAMDNGQNYVAINFAVQVIQFYLVDDRNSLSFVTDQDFFNTSEVLVRIATHSRQPPEGLVALIELLRATHDPALIVDSRTHASAHILSGLTQGKARDYDDPPGLAEKTEFLLREWVSIYNSAAGAKDPNKSFSIFVSQMNYHGILKTDDLITRFFRLSTQMVVELCYRFLPDVSGASATSSRNKMFHTVDAYVKLISLLVKHSGDATNTATKVNLLNKVLGIIAGVLQQDHETHQTEFQQLPYQRIFIMLFLELNAHESILEAINFQVLTAYFHTLHILRPAKSPGFAYAWLELVSHRLFLGRMLSPTPSQKSNVQSCPQGWIMYAQLLVDLFKYLAPFLRNAELAKPVTVLYKGTLRVLLVLLHDFPEFLCDYHYGFCDAIPPNCIQMRNLILSAFPRNMRLPDPFTPNLKVDMLAEISSAPRVLTEFAFVIQPTSFKKDLDHYLKARTPVTFLSDLRSNLQVSNEPGLRYNIPLMNALVLYVGTEAIAHIRKKGLAPNMTTIAHSAHMDIFQNLAVDLDTEGRYLFLNGIANQLRYPNSHTHYFSCTLLYLFAEANTEAIQEQITRVLLERLIVNRPHPWGLLITFIELIKNPTYKFWTHEFVHCAPEIEKLFESVARSCMVQKHVQTPAENNIPEINYKAFNDMTRKYQQHIMQESIKQFQHDFLCSNQVVMQLR